MAARLDQLARDLAAVLEDVDDGAKALGEAGLQAGMAQDEAQRLRQAAVDELEVPFEGEIVGQVELADARRIAAAAEILQEQRVIEVGELGLAKPISRPISCRSSAAHAVAGGLALGDIERMAERAHNRKA